MKIINNNYKLLKASLISAAVSAFFMAGCGPELLSDPDFIGQNQEINSVQDVDDADMVNPNDDMVNPQAPDQEEAGGCPAGGCPTAQVQASCPSGNCDVPPEASNQTASRYDTHETQPTIVTKSHERQDAADHHNITHVHHRYQHHLHKRYVQQHKNFHTNEDTVVVDHPSSSSVTIPYKTRSTSCSKTPVKHITMPNKDYGCTGITYGCPTAGCGIAP